jgi:hypothetical protein
MAVADARPQILGFLKSRKFNPRAAKRVVPNLGSWRHSDRHKRFARFVSSS